MPKDSALVSVHQTGEAGEEVLAEKGASAVDTFGGKVFVRWDPEAHVTGFGPAAYFIEFLKTNGRWESWVRDCPLQYKSANAPPKQDILGTVMLSVLAGHKPGWRGTTSLGPRNLFQSIGFATLIEGFASASYGRGLHWCFVPDHKHGSGSGDHWHGGKGASPSTPLGRLVNRSSPGRTASRFQIRRERMPNETSVNANKVAKKELARVCDRSTRGWRLFIRMQRGSTLEMQVTTWQFVQTGIPNQYEDLSALQQIFTAWQSGLAVAA